MAEAEGVVVVEAEVEGGAVGGAVAAAAEAVDNQLDNALMGLIISLLAQDTSQLLLYASPVMHYLAIRGVNPQANRFYPAF